MGANKERSDWVWERQWAPHDEPTYRMVLEYVRPHDVILEIGAGDFRLSRRLAAKSRFVYGLEISPILVAFAKAEPKIDNLQIILGDAYKHPVPEDITLAVLLMRHCQGFGLLADKLIYTGCTRLVTNARWGMGVEMVDFSIPSMFYDDIDIGWYACRCGAVGFVEGSTQYLSEEKESQVSEVSACPECSSEGQNGSSACTLPPAEAPAIYESFLLAS